VRPRYRKREARISTGLVAVYGGGSFGREVAWLAQECGCEVVCFIEDEEAKQGQFLNGIPLLPLGEAHSRFGDARVVGGVGAPRTRELMMAKAKEVGFDFATLIHPRVERSRLVEIGEGAVICAGNILTTNIVLGRHVQINLGCTVGHDVVMGDFATLAPGVHVSGCVHLGHRTYIGTGAVFVNGTQDRPLVIGRDAVVGAGACVTKPVPPGVTVVGVPARPMMRKIRKEDVKVKARARQEADLFFSLPTPTGSRSAGLASTSGPKRI
jgi:sugar O-acyltransferase (sialic acid O-acetyltransferase NeuD family)